MNIVAWSKTLMLAAGAAPILYLMILLSIASVAVMLERTWYFARRRDDVEALSRDLRVYLESGDLLAARARMESSPSPEAAVVVAGLSQASRGAAAAEEALHGAALVQRLKLERNLSFLGTLGSNAPFIGLLGTVVGIVMAFDRLGDGHQAAAAAASTEVMASVGEALVATAIGLAVAIPAVVAFNHFQRRIKVVTTNADALGRVLLAYLRGAGEAGRA